MDERPPHAHQRSPAGASHEGPFDAGREKQLYIRDHPALGGWDLTPPDEIGIVEKWQRRQTLS
eukprot:362649-Chlamydomonas_euryale.AAC.4